MVAEIWKGRESEAGEEMLRANSWSAQGTMFRTGVLSLCVPMGWMSAVGVDPWARSSMRSSVHGVVCGCDLESHGVPLTRSGHTTPVSWCSLASMGLPVGLEVWQWGAMMTLIAMAHGSLDCINRNIKS